MRAKIILLIFTLTLFLSGNDLLSQQKSRIKRQFLQENIKTEKQQPPPETEFENIIEGIVTGNVNQISRYFAQQVYISLRTGEKGYYSNNQAYYLLDNFFRVYSPINFQTTSRMIEGSMPYLSGRLFCRFKGSIETYQVYLNLYWNGFRWEITQLSIN